MSAILTPGAMHQWAIASAYIEDLFERADEPGAPDDLVAWVARVRDGRARLNAAMAGRRTMEQALDWLRTQPDIEFAPGRPVGITNDA